MTTKLGQNFLCNKNIAKKIVDEFLPQPGPVLEIGAGQGILSESLLDKIPAGQLTLVEIDPFLIQNLRQRFGDQIQIIENNILEINLAKLYSQGQVGIIGNLPYLISKELIDWLIRQRAKISTAVLMLQKDFVDKLLSPAGKKKYNAQSVVFQLLFQTRRCFNVSPGSFLPRPKVMSAVLAVRPANYSLTASVDEFYNFVKLCFGSRRKTLWNNLALYYDKKVLAAIVIDLELSPQTRAEQLPANIFLSVFKRIRDNVFDFNR